MTLKYIIFHSCQIHLCDEIREGAVSAYFEDFFVKQRAKVRDKIIWTFDLIEELQKVPETYLKHVKTQKGYLKSGYNKAATFFEYSASLIRGN